MEAVSPSGGWIFYVQEEAATAMYMPGCLDIFVNDSHFFRFGSGFNIVRSTDGCHDLLDRFLKRKIEPYVKGRCYPALRCYCDKTNALFAATNEFCPFEVAFKAIDQGAESATEMCFLKLGAGGAVRLYEVYRIRMRRIPNGYARSFVETRLVPLGLYVEMETAETNSDGFTAKRAKWRVLNTGNNWLSPQESVVPDHEAYQKFCGLLVEARRRFLKRKDHSSVRMSILGQIEPLRRSYEPLYNYFCCLFDSGPEEIVSKIENLLMEINDAPVVFSEVKRRIEKKLVDEPFERDPQASLRFIRRSEILEPGDLERSHESSIGAIPSAQTTHRDDLELSGSPERRGAKKGVPSMLLSEKSNGEYYKEFLREVAAFKRQFPELMKEYSGRYIAMCDEQVVDNDSDVEELRKRIYENIPLRHVLIQLVSNDVDETTEMDTIGV